MSAEERIRETKQELSSTSAESPFPLPRENRLSRGEGVSPGRPLTLVALATSPKAVERDHDKRRASTGIPELDRLIEGGFPQGKSHLIIGEPGSGKSILCIQFVLRGLTDGEKAVYVAVDDKPSDIVEQAASLGWDLMRYVEKKQLLILDASPFFSARVGLGKDREIDVSKTVADLANYVKRVGASRLVIDPVGPLIASADSANAANQRARALVHALQDNLETTNLLTSYSLTHNNMGLEGEESPFASVVILKLPRRQKSLIRTLLVRKMRATALDLIEYRFNIVKERGIVMEPPSVASASMQAPAEGYSLFKEWQVK